MSRETSRSIDPHVPSTGRSRPFEVDPHRDDDARFEPLNTTRRSSFDPTRQGGRRARRVRDLLLPGPDPYHRGAATSTTAGFKQPNRGTGMAGYLKHQGSRHRPAPSFARAAIGRRRSNGRSARTGCRALEHGDPDPGDRHALRLPFHRREHPGRSRTVRRRSRCPQPVEECKRPASAGPNDTVTNTDGGPPSYIFVTGGVVSSLGKGLAAASIGRLLEGRGFRSRCRSSTRTSTSIRER